MCAQQNGQDTSPTIHIIVVFEDEQQDGNRSSGELRPGSNWLLIIFGFFANILCIHIDKSMFPLEIGKNTLKK